jgi:hypothetical protein
MSTITQAWLDLVPPRGVIPAEARPASEAQPETEPGDAITLSPDESRQLGRIMATTSQLPGHADNQRQAVCRILGPQRVAVILQNHERGLGTPVVVEP